MPANTTFIECECGLKLCEVMTTIKGDNDSRETTVVVTCPACDDNTLPRKVKGGEPVFFAGIVADNKKSAERNTFVYAKKVPGKAGHWHVNSKFH